MSGGDGFDRKGYEEALAGLRYTLDTAEVAGWPRKDAELADLHRLISKYPGEARVLLAEVESEASEDSAPPSG